MTTKDGVTQLPATRCPICSEILSAAGTSDGSNHAPNPGDLTLCVYCLRWLVYHRPLEQGPLRLRALMAAEWDALPEAERAALEKVFARADRAWCTSDGRRRALQRTRPH